MPIGIQRLNAKQSQPNPHIVFIKPLKGPDEKIAQGFLERIAAQCLPIMREHHIHVMSLEEFPPNREFVGRNFNAGEVIQLVLKSPGSGRWLPFNYVQMVMMHELAHCKQMNHSRAFWAVRNQYAAQMQGLWSKGYKGDGIWGRGTRLGAEEWERNLVRADEVLPEHLCGGTYRSRKGKRKAKPVLTYQERKERRIEKKFGKNGMALGADDEVKVKLEKGKRVQAKPRVASSARGRELRAAAALARFEQNTDDKSEIKKGEETDSDDTSDYESGDLQDTKDAVDIDGTRLVDKNGRGLVKVCEDENVDDQEAKTELDELQNMFGNTGFKGFKRVSPELSNAVSSMSTSRRSVKQEEDQETFIKPEGENYQNSPKLSDIPVLKPATPARLDKLDTVQHDRLPKAEERPITVPPAGSQTCEEATNHCSTCSFANADGAVTCTMCSNVLSPSQTPGAWRCSHASCINTAYMNSGDCGMCGLCGQRRKSGTTETGK